MNGQDVYVPSDNRCLFPGSGTEFRASCSVPERYNVLPQVFWMLCSQCPKTVNILIWRLQKCLSALSRKTYGSPTDKACVHLTWLSLISVACVSFSTAPTLQLLSLPSLSHALWGWWQYLACPTSQKGQSYKMHKHVHQQILHIAAW